jgi:hypothetical protein
MLDLGSTSFVISPNAAKAFKIPVVKRIKKRSIPTMLQEERLLPKDFIQFLCDHSLGTIVLMIRKIMLSKS